jgi:hypothetical protein
MFEYIFVWLANLGLEVIIVIGLIIIYLSFVTYKLLTIDAKLAYETYNINIIKVNSELLQDQIEISFKGSKINRLTENIVVFWNAGKKTLFGKDILKNNPIRFEYCNCDKNGSGRVLSATLLRESRKTNNFSLKVDEDMSNIVNLNFSHLEPGEGAVIELLHSTKNDFPEIKGEIKGVPRGIIDSKLIYDELWPEIPDHLKKPFNIIAFTIVAVLSFFLTLAVIDVYQMFPGHPLEFLTPSGKLLNAVMILSFAIVLGLFTMVYLKSKKNYPKNLSVDKYIKRLYE